MGIEQLSNLNPQYTRYRWGFQKNFGCLIDTFMLPESVYYSKENGSKRYVCFLDVRKAFDCVWHGGLHFKIYKYGMDKSIFKVF